jgi:hypothetical protein
MRRTRTKALATDVRERRRAVTRVRRDLMMRSIRKTLNTRASRKSFMPGTSDARMETREVPTMMVSNLRGRYQFRGMVGQQKDRYQFQ